MNIQTRQLGVHERAVCQNCSWSHNAMYAAPHVASFPDHRVLTISTETTLTFNVPTPKEPEPDAG